MCSAHVTAVVHVGPVGEAYAKTDVSRSSTCGLASGPASKLKQERECAWTYAVHGWMNEWAVRVVLLLLRQSNASIHGTLFADSSRACMCSKIVRSYPAVLFSTNAATPATAARLVILHETLGLAECRHLWRGVRVVLVPVSHTAPLGRYCVPTNVSLLTATPIFCILLAMPLLAIPLIEKLLMFWTRQTVFVYLPFHGHQNTYKSHPSVVPVQQYGACVRRAHPDTTAVGPLQLLLVYSVAFASHGCSTRSRVVFLVHVPKNCMPP